MAIRTLLLLCVAMLASVGAAGQEKVDMGPLRDVPAVTGHELMWSKGVLASLKDLHPQSDNLGNVWVTFGSGEPHRLIAAPIDEPGYVVSEITADGYLRVQRLPQAAPNAVFDALSFAQPVVIVTRSGKEVAGVFGGLSVHLQPGRLNPPKMNHIEVLYIDIGAKNAEEVRAAGVDLLDPVNVFEKDTQIYGAEAVGIRASEQACVDVLFHLIRRIEESKAAGTTTIAFVTQQWLGGRGLNRLLTEMTPDEMVYLGRVTPTTPEGKEAKPAEINPRGGVVLGTVAGSDAFAERFKALAATEKIDVQSIVAAPPRLAGYVKGAAIPKQFVEVGLPLLWPLTPAEIATMEAAHGAEHLLAAYLGIAGQSGWLPGGSGGGIGQFDIKALTEAYGASGHEGAVRKVVLDSLPEWARKLAVTDAAGNLVLHVGNAKKDAKTPRIAFIAHMDEIGYEVKRIEDDGRLQVEVLGGGYPQYFLGHAVLVHKKDGMAGGGVLELPNGWDKPGFEFPVSMRAMDDPAHVYVGTNNQAETEKLGIAVGDFVTIPKQYRSLLGTRANARSFDDRVGCVALIRAVQSLGKDAPHLEGRDVTFVWSTEEEVGLKGAAAFAEQSAKEGRAPDFVFAIDTFVSADSPLESKRFGDAEIGKGFVVRAVDNSNVVPLEYVDRVVKLANENKIPVQYGVTGGGNDGAVFTRFGSVDVALGWPLRYSHSPAEVIDTRDLDALAKIVAVLAKQW
ncbi:MAG TPA: M20/M25/M40 family metallo-hydrolase [Candidatus Saccharimonadales bacterium]|nr:M20/M25/M40 family metallo-hydrolase [Candidatus Saccharimonadales bacterium]